MMPLRTTLAGLAMCAVMAWSGLRTSASADQGSDSADQRSDSADQRSDSADQRSDSADQRSDSADQRSDSADQGSESSRKTSWIQAVPFRFGFVPAFDKDDFDGHITLGYSFDMRSAPVDHGWTWIVGARLLGNRYQGNRFGGTALLSVVAGEAVQVGLEAGAGRRGFSDAVGFYEVGLYAELFPFLIGLRMERPFDGDNDTLLFITGGAALPFWVGGDTEP